LPDIEVPFIQQRSSADCVVACVAMVMSWARATYSDVGEFSYEEIASVLGCQQDGTPLENVERLNGHGRVTGHLYQPQFSYTWATNIGFLWHEIDEGRPVIAYVLRRHLDAQFVHAVVVRGYSNDKTTMHINDPLECGPAHVPTSRFIHEWESLYRTVARVTVIESRDTKIPDFEVERE